MNPLIASGLYFGLVLALAETARRRLGVAPDITRSSVLAAIGAWTLPAVSLFGEPRSAAAPFLLLAAVLYFSFRFELLAAIENDGPSPGSVLAPLSIALLLIALGKDSLHIALAGIFSMAFGDGAATLVGRRLGTRKYRILGHPRTMEGTLACFLVSSAAAAPALALVGLVDWHQAVAFALIAGTVGASVEAVSVYGTDNLTVPLAVAATLTLLMRASN
ncbi:MAG: hypothetical protein ACRD21_21350 [Vicinamibacteria bacterium]